MRPPRYGVTVTRFNNKTWEENRTFRRRKEESGAVYGSPRPLSDDAIAYEACFVIEMNNETNQILGVGLIQCCPARKKERIYEWGHYNRYTYRGNKRSDIGPWVTEFRKSLGALTLLLFHGKGHFKRGQGISLLPGWIADSPLLDLRRCFSRILGLDRIDHPKRTALPGKADPLQGPGPLLTIARNLRNLDGVGATDPSEEGIAEVGKVYKSLETLS